MTRRQKGTPETYWLDETDPSELRRRAEDLRKDGLLAAARELEQRADQLERWP